MTIIPTGGRILIKKLDRGEARTEAGILMPGQTLQEESLYYGEVMRDSGEYKEGQRVFYSRYSATVVRDDKGNPFYIVSDLDIMAVEK